MDWRLILELALAGVAAVNFVMILTIRNEILQLELRQRDWCRAQFASAGEVQRELQEIREGMRHIDNGMAHLVNRIESHGR